VRCRDVSPTAGALTFAAFCISIVRFCVRNDDLSDQLFLPLTDQCLSVTEVSFRRKELYGDKRRIVVDTIKQWARIKGIEIIDGHAMADHCRFAQLDLNLPS
jgi:hypothetical protein